MPVKNYQEAMACFARLRLNDTRAVNGMLLNT